MKNYIIVIKNIVNINLIRTYINKIPNPILNSYNKDYKKIFKQLNIRKPSKYLENFKKNNARYKSYQIVNLNKIKLMKKQ